MNDTLTLMRLYAKRRRVELTTLGRLMRSSSTVAERLAQGRVTIATVQRIEHWLSDNWPDDLDWPADIPRPAPRSNRKHEEAA